MLEILVIYLYLINWIIWKGRDNGKKVYNVLKNELIDEELTLYEVWEYKRRIWYNNI